MKLFLLLAIALGLGVAIYKWTRKPDPDEEMLRGIFQQAMKNLEQLPARLGAFAEYWNALSLEERRAILYEIELDRILISGSWRGGNPEWTAEKAARAWIAAVEQEYPGFPLPPRMAGGLQLMASLEKLNLKLNRPSPWEGKKL